MRVRLMIDVETDDIPLLQRFVGEEPVVHLRFDNPDGSAAWTPLGRFVGAKEAFDAVAEVAVARDRS